MLSQTIIKTGGLLGPRAPVLLNNTISRSYYKEKFFYYDRYDGKMDYFDREKYPKRISPYKEEELLDEIHTMRASEITEPSPFHIVTRIKSMSGAPWYQKVTLRRLNLHSSRNGDVVVVPNTPQFNELLFKVKHMISLKPAIFENGHIPTEEDIGAIKVCPYTGKIKVDEKVRLSGKRVNVDKPPLFQGCHLRYKIMSSTGMHQANYATQKLT